MVEQEGLAALLFSFCGGQPARREGSQRPIPGEDQRWPAPRDTVIIFHKPVGGLSKAALSRFVSRAQRTARLDGRVNVLVTTSRDLRRLNQVTKKGTGLRDRRPTSSERLPTTAPPGLEPGLS